MCRPQPPPEDRLPEAEIKQWLVGNGTDPEKVTWYLDKETGKTLDRPAFQRFQKAIFDSTVKTVVVWKLDRLRRLWDGVTILAEWCDKGLRVIVVTQPARAAGPSGSTRSAV